MSELDYASYLQLDTLLSLQKTHTPPSADRAVAIAEHFFMIVHQSSELWLKQVIIDLTATTRSLQPLRGDHNPELGLEFLRRATELLRVLQNQLACLEMLPLRHFAEFRPYLGNASGAQSEQFHTVDTLLGGADSNGRLYDAFCAAVHYEGMTVLEVCRLGVEAGVFHRIAEELLDAGNAFWRWKTSHVAVTSKMIGTRVGTGGTQGTAYLAKRAAMPFPELRRLRGQVHRDHTHGHPERHASSS